MDEIDISLNETPVEVLGAMLGAMRDERSTLPAWDGALYAANTGHHRHFDDAFLDTLPIQPGARVLDLGCGSGDFTAIVAARVPDGEVVGLDPQRSLLERAEAVARPNQRFVQGAAQELGRCFPDGDAFDIVLSRAVLQWVPLADHFGVLVDVRRLLRPDGWFRAEFGAAGNIATVVELLDDVSSGFGGPTSPWTFADPGQYLELIERAGLDLGPGFVRSTPQRRPFTRESLLGWFRSQAVQAYRVAMDAPAGEAFQREVERRLDELARWDGTFDQTFVRMDVLARRPA